MKLCFMKTENDFCLVNLGSLSMLDSSDCSINLKFLENGIYSTEIFT